MKRSFLLFMLAILSFCTRGQFVQLADGPTFPDPGTGYAKILQMKNFNTLFLHITFDKGITVHVYESQYKAKTETLVEPAYGKLESGKVEGIFEVNGDAVLMLSCIRNNELQLYRLVIDGKTGKLKDEKQLAALKRSAGSITEMAVRKDPASEFYAVALLNSSSADSGRKIGIILFGKDNRELHRAQATQGFNKYKSFRFLDMTVVGDDKVVLLLNAYNTNPAGEKAGDVLFTSLDKDSKDLLVKELNYSNDLVIENGITRYDPKIEKIILLTVAKVNSESGNLKANLSLIDPLKRILVYTHAINAGEQVDLSYKDFYGSKALYSGLPQNLVVNPDGTYTVIFEEKEVERKKDSVDHSILRNTAVVNYDQEANIKSAWFIPLEHYISGNEMPPFYQSVHELAGQEFNNNCQYKTSTYISDGHQHFLLFNDNSINVKTAESGTVTAFKELDFADAFYCKTGGKNNRLNREYVFGKPVTVSGKIQHQPGVFSVYDYDRDNNILVTLKQDPFRDQPGYKLVWLQP